MKHQIYTILHAVRSMRFSGLQLISRRFISDKNYNKLAL